MPVSDLDKLAHGLAFGILGALLRWGVGGVRERARTVNVWCGIVAMGYGAMDEVHQMFVAGRTPSIGDWIADAIGAVIGVWLVDRAMRARA
jgi:VanZ family protein